MGGSLLEYTTSAPHLELTLMVKRLGVTYVKVTHAPKGI
jgi:hypothetical protein